MTNRSGDMPADVGDLQRLLGYLSLHPCPEIEELSEFQRQTTEKPLTTYTEDRLAELGQIVLERRDLRQFGLFQFQVGLIYLAYGRFQEAAARFQAAQRQWRFFKERPPIALARFAQGLAFQYDRDRLMAGLVYAGAEEEAARIRREVREPAFALQGANHQLFIAELDELLAEVRERLQIAPLVVPPPVVQEEFQIGSGQPRELLTDRRALQKLLVEHFGLSAFKDLGQVLGVDFDSLPGDHKGDKVSWLVALFETQGQTMSLLRWAKGRRPDVDWEGTIQMARPEDQFVAPAPLGENDQAVDGEREWYKVVRKTAPFLSEIQEGDLLVVQHTTAANLALNEWVVVEGQMAGSVQLRSAREETTQPFYLARFVHSAATGEVRVMLQPDRPPVAVNALFVRGRVLRRCKNL